MFIGNSATGQNAWHPIGDEPMPSWGPTGDDVDHESHTEFMESSNTNLVSDLPDTIDELKQVKKRKTKKVIETTRPCSKTLPRMKYCRAWNHL